MALPMRIVCPEEFPVKIVKWKVKKDSMVMKGSILGLYENLQTNSQIKLKSSATGIVDEIYVKAGVECQPGMLLLTLRQQDSGGCTHPTVMKEMCADCGADLRREYEFSGDRKQKMTASVAMVHNIPELIVSQEQAMEIGREDEKRLLKTRKLVLLVDLDQTLIHTTNDNIPPQLKDVYHFKLWQQGPHSIWYHTRLRPHTHSFLQKVSKMYELHICTFGVRLYAHTVARLIDPDEKFFSHRILSRDECFDPLSKTANLKALFPCGDSMVCIIDDREDVWNQAPNLVHVKPYRFFQGTADINAPPGLDKSENDIVPLVHKIVDHHSHPGKMTENCDKGCKKIEEQKGSGVEIGASEKQKGSGEEIRIGEEQEGSGVEIGTSENQQGSGVEIRICEEQKGSGLEIRTSEKHKGSGAEIRIGEEQEGSGVEIGTSEKQKGSGAEIRIGEEQEGSGVEIGTSENQKGSGAEIRIGEEQEGSGLEIGTNEKQKGSGAEIRIGEEQEGSVVEIGTNEEQKGLQQREERNGSDKCEEQQHNDRSEEQDGSQENPKSQNQNGTYENAECEEKIEKTRTSKEGSEPQTVHRSEEQEGAENTETYEGQNSSQGGEPSTDSNKEENKNTKSNSAEKRYENQAYPEGDQQKPGEMESSNTDMETDLTEGCESEEGKEKVSAEKNIAGEENVSSQGSAPMDSADLSHDLSISSDSDDRVSESESSSGCQPLSAEKNIAGEVNVSSQGSAPMDTADLSHDLSISSDSDDRVSESESNSGCQPEEKSAASLKVSATSVESADQCHGGSLTEETSHEDRAACSDSVQEDRKELHETKPAERSGEQTADSTLATTQRESGKQPVQALNQNHNSGESAEKARETVGKKKEQRGDDDEEEIEWDDDDDYLLYLEDILTRIHQAFYAMIDENQPSPHFSQQQQQQEECTATLHPMKGSKPNLKSIIPYVKRKTLKGCNLVFSGLVPLNTPLENSQVYRVAVALGATVQQNILRPKDAGGRRGKDPATTTHLVAAKAGTSKHKMALRTKGVHIVNSKWLWVCNERWERCDERLFALANDLKPSCTMSENKKKPCKSNKRKLQPKKEVSMSGKKRQKREVAEVEREKKKNKDRSMTEGVSDATISLEEGISERRSSSFAESVPPLLAFSDEDLECMDKEVDELMAEESGSENETDNERDRRYRDTVLGSVTDSSSSDSLSGDYPRGWGLRRRSNKSPNARVDDLEKRKHEAIEMETEDTENELVRFQKTVETFSPDSDSSNSSEYAESIGSVDDELAEAVEKEFLASL